MRRKHVRIVTVLIACVLVVVSIAIFATRHPVRSSYLISGQGSDGDICASVELGGVVSARTSGVLGRLHGWGSAQLEPAVTKAFVTDCRSGQPFPTRTISLDQYWQESSCGLSAADLGAEGEADEDDEDDEDGGGEFSSVTVGDCAKTSVHARSTRTGSSLQDYLSIDPVRFDGHLLDDRLCFTATVIVTTGLRSVRPAMPQVCLTS